MKRTIFKPISHKSRTGMSCDVAQVLAGQFDDGSKCRTFHK